MNQLIVPLEQVQPQEQTQALMVQAQWFSSVMIGIAAAGAVLALLPKIVGAVRKKE